MKKITFILFVLFSTIISSCQTDSKANDQVTNTIEDKTKITYHLKGFKSSCCIGIVKYSLDEVDGVLMIRPNTNKEEITVWYDGNKVTDQKIQEAINLTPYKVLSTTEVIKM